MHAGFGALRAQMPMDMRARHSVPRTPDLVDDIARIDALWSECRGAHSRGGDFLFGAWSAADAMFAPVVSRFRTYDVELSPRRERLRGRGLGMAGARGSGGRGGRGALVSRFWECSPMPRPNLSYAELEAGLPEIKSSPREHGPLAMIVRRPQSGEREVLKPPSSTSTLGLVGDRWALGNGGARTSSR